MRRSFILLGVCLLVIFSYNLLSLQQVRALEEGTFESFGHVYNSKSFNSSNYKESAALSEVMPIFEEIRMAIQKRDIESYKRYASSNVIKMIAQYGMKLTDKSPVEVSFDAGWEGKEAVLMNVTLKYSGEDDTQGSPVFIKEDGNWKMDTGLGLKY
ncbi:MAG: hypothetical protein NTU54_05530 [Candidatus Omnitrophica bacterium]|nr:hypothetical protein [Candidatus Omnitrophota bacterium]